MKKDERIAALVAQLGAAADLSLDPRYQGYFTCFNAQQYYEAHDVLENLWLETKGRDFLFFKGLIQVAGAFVHLQKHFLHPDHAKHGRRLRPAGRLFHLALANLESFAPAHLHLNVAQLRRLCRDLGEEVAASDFQRNPWRPDRAPQLRLDFAGPIVNSACDVLIIGGGAAGLFCAIEAGRRGRRVVLLEHNDRVGKKIAISGGGRCNFTNLGATPENYSSNPDFCKSALARYTPSDFVALVEKHGIPYHEKKLGQQFCDSSSRAIIDLLLAECAAAKVDIRINCRVESIEKPERFRVATNHGTFESASLVVACGGLSFAKLGASDFGYRVARQFGLRITELRPGLVPLTFDAKDRALQELSGVSVPVIARNRGQEFEENLLFTHRGISGPAVLQISSYWREGETLHFDLLPGVNGGWDAARKTERDLPALLSRHWPRRFAETWSARYGSSKLLAHYKDREWEDLAARLRKFPMRFSGTEGYPKAEVTLGGVDTRGLSSKTMEARDVPGLYFIGEVVDVTGWLGGYNFQWAWASAHAAGQFV